jgi:hypothetical protein
MSEQQQECCPTLELQAVDPRMGPISREEAKLLSPAERDAGMMLCAHSRGENIAVITLLALVEDAHGRIIGHAMELGKGDLGGFLTAM